MQFVCLFVGFNSGVLQFWFWLLSVKYTPPTKSLEPLAILHGKRNLWIVVSLKHVIFFFSKVVQFNYSIIFRNKRMPPGGAFWNLIKHFQKWYQTFCRQCTFSGMGFKIVKNCVYICIFIFMQIQQNNKHCIKIETKQKYQSF